MRRVGDREPWPEMGGSRDMPPEEEARQIAESFACMKRSSLPSLGWYTGRCSMNTVRLTPRHGGSPGFPTPMTSTLPIGANTATMTSW